MILDSLWPPEAKWAENGAKPVADAVRLILKLCREDPTCTVSDKATLETRMDAFVRDWLKTPVAAKGYRRPFPVDDFYVAIRYFYNARAQAPDFRRLSFVLVGVATPSDLTRDPARTPFNIGRHVEVGDFTPAEARPLADGLGLPEDQAGQVLRWVFDWTGGHPYLTQRLCEHLAKQGRPGWSGHSPRAAVVVRRSRWCCRRTPSRRRRPSTTSCRCWWGWSAPSTTGCRSC